MSIYVRHRKSLDYKSKKSKKSEESALRSSYGESPSSPLGSAGFCIPILGVSLKLELELISNSMPQLSDSLAASVEASFLNMESLINDMISHVS